jgi:hypothetical protein
MSLTPFSENGKKCVKFNTILWLCYFKFSSAMKKHEDATYLKI